MISVGLGSFDVGFFLGLTTALLFGAAIIPARKAVIQTSAVVGCFLSLLAGLPVLIIAIVISGEFSSIPSISPLFVVYLSAAGILNFGIGRTLSFISAGILGANRSAPFFATAALHSIMFGGIVLAEDVGPEVISGAALVVSGVTIISLTQSGRKEKISRRQKVIGISAGLGVGLFNAMSWLLIKGALSELQAPILASATSYIMTIAITLPFVINKWRSDSPPLRDVNKLLYAVTGFLAAGGQMAKFAALGTAAVSVVGSLVNVAPLFTLVFSFIFIRNLEVTRYQVLSGALLVVVGAIVAGRS